MLSADQLNRDIPVPLYFQLKEIILSEIKKGTYKDDDAIPTEKELSEIFDISRTTIRQAIKELENEGWLYRLKSKGTFVSRPKINQNFAQTMQSFNDEIRNSGRTPKTELLDFKVIAPSEDIARVLNLGHREQAIYVHRRRFADEEPIVMVKTYLPYEKCSFVLEHNLREESLYTILGIKEETKIFTIDRLVEAENANSYDVKNLGVKSGMAIQQFTSLGYNVFDDVIEYSVARYRGDRNIFKVTVAPYQQTSNNNGK